MTMFMDLVQKAQKAELDDFEKNAAEERKKAEALRLQHHPGSISGSGLLAERDDQEEKLNKQLDEQEAAARQVAKDKEDAERADANAPFPPPPITVSG